MSLLATNSPFYESGAVVPIPLAEFRERVLALYDPKLRSQGRLTKMTRIFDQLAALGVATTADLTLGLVARFIAACNPDESKYTTHGRVADLRAACNIAAGEGWLRISPFMIRSRWIKRGSPLPVKVHSREEIARVLAMLEGDARRLRGWAGWRAHRLYALASLVAFTAVRKNEALHLRVSDVQLESGMLLIVSGRDHETKTEASAQPVPIPDALAAILRSWLPRVETCGWLFPNATRTGPWTSGGPGYRPLDCLKAAGARAGVDEFTFQSLRHSWATHAEFWGLTDAQIQRIMRHTSTSTQWLYRKAETRNLRGLARGIDFNEPEPPPSGTEARP